MALRGLGHHQWCLRWDSDGVVQADNSQRLAPHSRDPAHRQCNSKQHELVHHNYLSEIRFLAPEEQGGRVAHVGQVLPEEGQQSTCAPQEDYYTLDSATWDNRGAFKPEFQ